MTDGSKQLNSGEILLEFLTPPFSANDAFVVIDLATGNGKICLFYPTAGCLPGATEAVVFEGSFTLDVVKLDQTITGLTANPASAVVDGSSSLSANASSGLPVSDFDSNTPSVCSVSGSTVMYSTVGTCTVTADQAGNDSFNAAPQVTLDINVGKANQNIIGFAADPASAVVDGSSTLSATASSGLPVTFGSNTVSTCTVAGTNVSYEAVGTCTVIAVQAGNDNYNAAPQETLDIEVTQAALSLSIADVDFGEIEVNTVSPAQIVTVSNTGTADLNVTGIDAVAAPFALTGGSCGAVFTLAPTDSCTLEYTFSPGSAGAASQSINVTSNAPSNPDTLTLRGDGFELNRSFGGTLPSGTSGTLSFETADPRCTFNGTPRFLSGDGITPEPPDRFELFDGLASFTIGNCTPGATVTMSLDYGVEVPMGTQVWKVAAPWKALRTRVAGTTVSWQLTDGGENDEDGAANGTLVDPSGAGRVLPFVAIPVPVNGAWALVLLLLLITSAGVLRLRKS